MYLWRVHWGIVFVSVLTKTGEYVVIQVREWCLALSFTVDFQSYFSLFSPKLRASTLLEKLLPLLDLYFIRCKKPSYTLSKRVFIRPWPKIVIRNTEKLNRRNIRCFCLSTGTSGASCPLDWPSHARTLYTSATPLITPLPPHRVFQTAVSTIIHVCLLCSAHTKQSPNPSGIHYMGTSIAASNPLQWLRSAQLDNPAPLLYKQIILYNCHHQSVNKGSFGLLCNTVLCRQCSLFHSFLPSSLWPSECQTLQCIMQDLLVTDHRCIIFVAQLLTHWTVSLWNVPYPRTGVSTLLAMRTAIQMTRLSWSTWTENIKYIFTHMKSTYKHTVWT